MGGWIKFGNAIIGNASFGMNDPIIAFRNILGKTPKIGPRILSIIQNK
jgi:hypothetical protein